MRCDHDVLPAFYERGCSMCAWHMIRAGTHLDALDGNGETALAKMVRNLDSRFVLKEWFRCYNRTSNGISPMSYVLEGQKFHVSPVPYILSTPSLLIANGVSVNCVDVDAILQGICRHDICCGVKSRPYRITLVNIQLLEMLVKAGANLHISISNRDRLLDFSFILDSAINAYEKSCISMITYLINKCATVNTLKELAIYKVRSLLKPGAPFTNMV